jgi:hypothetical protein
VLHRDFNFRRVGFHGTLLFVPTGTVILFQRQEDTSFF